MSERKYDPVRPGVCTQVQFIQICRTRNLKSTKINIQLHVLKLKSMPAHAKFSTSNNVLKLKSWLRPGTGSQHPTTLQQLLINEQQPKVDHR